MQRLERAVEGSLRFADALLRRRQFRLLIVTSGVAGQDRLLQLGLRLPQTSLRRRDVGIGLNLLRPAPDLRLTQSC